MGTILSDPLVGHVLDGRYRVESRLARGGMGTVYLALDTRLDRTVALKVMNPTLADDEEFVHRFIGEAKSAARLSHPNVVGVYDQGRDGSHLFLAMEFVPGRTLRDLLNERGPLGPHRALPIIEAVLAALGAAHRADLVHRDVKPENVLLADDGQVKVTDFGLARAVVSSNHTKTSGLLIGTVGYLSPEQVEHGVADQRSDVYAAGVMLFELLTGRRPFDGETPLAVAYKHVNNSVPPPSSLMPGLPPALDDLVVRATGREPAQRPADANELLGVAIAARRTLPPPPPAPENADHLAIAGGEMPTEVIRRDVHDTLVVPGTPTYTPPLGGPPGGPRAPVRAGAPGPPPPARSRRIPRNALLAGVLALVVLAGTALLGFLMLMTEVPNGLTGITMQAATAKAEQMGLRVEVGPARNSDEVPKNHVMATDPAAGDMMRRGGTITLIPSKGPRMIPVPDVRGEELKDAKSLIREAGLTPGKVRRASSISVPKGEVIRTSPAAGEKIRHDSTVRIVVSRGVPIPDVRGTLLEEAEKALKERGFDIDVTEKYSEAYPKGRVVAQDPARGGAAKGSTISLTVSKGPPMVTVPDVLGMPIDEATERLEDAGFQVKEHQFGGDRVRLQRPTGRVPKGSTITIVAL
ncbi:MAG: Stk1 family PASTA domain-containing Ser/Thr kinase [Streptosporangiales bacterium]|nr:Stk1 family PASTA domain-containing Ser/Thr kinase [Streptosporangiales bacterium]